MFKFTLTQFICILLQAMFVSNASSASGQRIMKLLTSNVRSNANYVTNCSTKISDGKLNLEYFLVKPLEKGYMSKIDFQMFIREDKRYHTLFTHDYDICKVLNGLVRANSLLHAWYMDMVRHSNLMAPCPIPKGPYFVHNMTLSSPSIPAYLSSGDYRMTLHNYSGKRKTKSEIFILSVSMDLQIIKVGKSESNPKMHVL